MDHGDFEAAMILGEAEGTADGLAIAAEALNAPVMLLQTDNPKKQAKRAMAMAARAVAADPTHAEARLQYALALGFVTRASNPITVWRKGMAADLTEAIDDYLALDPESARGHALRGAWHYGIVRKAGQKRAENWYGATLAGGNTAYDRALELSPHDIIIEANYALSLIDQDYDTNQARARDMLTDCTDTPPKDAVERAVQAQINTVLERWDEPDYVRKQAALWLDGE